MRLGSSLVRTHKTLEHRMFGFVLEFLLVTFLLAYHTGASTGSSGKARNGQDCVRTETAPSGNIFSPDYGVVYPPSVVCKWTIKAPVGSKIYLVFNDFLIEKSKSCKNDYLLLFDGPNDASRKVGRYCGTAPAPFTSSSNFIHLEFYSDISLQYRGFHAYYNRTLSTTVKPTQWQSLPRFLNTLLNRTVVEGSLVKLICEVDGTPEPVISWKKNSQNLTQDKRLIIKKSSLESVVTITKVNKKDQGRYTCVAYNGVGPNIEAHGWLVVKKRVSPLINKTTENKTVLVGSNLQLDCEATGQPPLKIVWIEKDKPLAEKTCSKSFDCELKFTIMLVQDTHITCEVANIAGNASKNVYIRVKGPPLIIHSPQEKVVERGQPVNFTCEAIGKPPLKISWTENDKIISKGVTTVEGRSVVSLSAKENATLTCTVEGESGITSKEAQLTVSEKENHQPVKPTAERIPLKFLIAPDDIDVKHKGSAILHCQVKGYPEPQLSWLLYGRINIRATREANGVSILKLESLEETVHVTCVARNKYENINSTATVTVLSAPVLKSGTFNNNMKLIVGAVSGILLLTVIVIFILLVRRRKRNKKIAREGERPGETTRDSENLIPNPSFSKPRQESDAKPGVEMLHYPRDEIVHCEDIDDGINVQMFLGRATDLPFASGEYNVVVRVFKDNDPSDEKKEEFDIEASLLANLVHPNVVRLMAVCIKTPPLSLIFEYSECGYLDEYLQDCDPSDFAKKSKRKAAAVRDSFTELANVDRLSIAKQVAAGMEYLREKGYIHQELRTRNCLVFKDLQVKVANLGLHWAEPEQNFFVMEAAEKQRFPVRWLPPEVILYGEYSESADVWSYGVLVWEVFSDAQLPYTGINDNDVVSYVRGYNILPRPKACPHDVYEVLKSCWEMTPLQRPNFSSLHETMSSLHDGVPV